MASDTIPIIIGMVVSFFIVRWIYQNRNSLEPSEGPAREAMQQLASMFPNVPLSVIRNEMARAGSMPAAIERLLALSSTYPVRLPERQYRDSTPTHHKNTLQSIAQLPLAEVPSKPLQVDSESWSKDASLRERLLVQKKQEMLLKARRRFLEKDLRPVGTTRNHLDQTE